VACSAPYRMTLLWIVRRIYAEKKLLAMCIYFSFPFPTELAHRRNPRLSVASLSLEWAYLFFNFFIELVVSNDIVCAKQCLQNSGSQNTHPGILVAKILHQTVENVIVKVYCRRQGIH
jgi:hypothetical protein